MPDLSLSTRRNGLKLLYRACGHHARLPKALHIPVHYDHTGDALYRGGFADVWKGECHGREVAVKVIRTYSNSELQKVSNVGSCQLFLRLCTNNALTEVLQGGCDVEIPSTSECPTTNRNSNVGESIRDGIRLDGKREYQRIYQGASGGGSLQACGFYIEVLLSLSSRWLKKNCS